VTPLLSTAGGLLVMAASTKKIAGGIGAARYEE